MQIAVNASGEVLRQLPRQEILYCSLERFINDGSYAQYFVRSPGDQHTIVLDSYFGEFSEKEDISAEEQEAWFRECMEVIQHVKNVVLIVPNLPLNSKRSENLFAEWIEFAKINECESPLAGKVSGNNYKESKNSYKKLSENENISMICLDGSYGSEPWTLVNKLGEEGIFNEEKDHHILGYIPGMTEEQVSILNNAGIRSCSSERPVYYPLQDKSVITDTEDLPLPEDFYQMENLDKKDLTAIIHEIRKVQNFIK